MPQSLSNIYVHLIFSTKGRAPLISDDIRKPLHSYLATVLANLKSPAILINSVEDHVHVLFKLSRTISLAKLIEDLKCDSSKWMKKQGPDLANFYWQNGYGAFSVSESNTPKVANYIRKQREHHQQVDFKDEFRSFLIKHKIEFNEEYLWD